MDAIECCTYRDEVRMSVMVRNCAAFMRMGSRRSRTAVYLSGAIRMVNVVVQGFSRMGAKAAHISSPINSNPKSLIYVEIIRYKWSR